MTFEVVDKMTGKVVMHCDEVSCIPDMSTLSHMYSNSNYKFMLNGSRYSLKAIKEYLEVYSSIHNKKEKT